MPHSPHIAVVGSINADRTLRTDRLPQPGETLTAKSVVEGDGGKGANQAVGLARLGCDVVMVGAVGRDSPGERLVENLADEGIDVGQIVRTTERTGSATIVVDDTGENMIIVDPGANGTLATDHVAIEQVRTAGAVLLQMEIPDEAIAAAVRTATGTVVLNPAPARPLSADILDGVDYLVPNRSELGVIADVTKPATESAVLDAASRIPFSGVVITTLGVDGAIAVHDGEIVASARPPRVEVVDTVGAGDAFCAAFTAGIVADMPLEDAVERAVRAGAFATTKPGARDGLPTSTDLDAV